MNQLLLVLIFIYNHNCLNFYFYMVIYPVFIFIIKLRYNTNIMIVHHIYLYFKSNLSFAGCKRGRILTKINIMNSLLLVNETFSNGYRDMVLDIISLISVLSGILVIISKNPIVSVLFFFDRFILKYSMLFACFRYKFYRVILLISLCWSSFNFIFIYINVN